MGPAPPVFTSQYCCRIPPYSHTRHWLEVLQGLDNTGLKALVPGHGPAAGDPVGAVRLTLRYPSYIRESMAEAVEEMVPFADACAATDWSEFENLPAFAAAHRRNAYGVCLSLENELFAE